MSNILRRLRLLGLQIFYFRVCSPWSAVASRQAKGIGIARMGSDSQKIISGNCCLIGEGMCFRWPVSI